MEVVDVNSQIRIIDPTVTVEATPDYSTGDVMGGLLELKQAVRPRDNRSFLQSICITSEISMAADSVDVIIFDANPSSTTFTENAAVAIAEADLSKIAGVVTLDKAMTVATAGFVLQKTSIGLPVKGTNGSLWAVLVARATFNFTATDNIKSCKFGLI